MSFEKKISYERVTGHESATRRSQTSRSGEDALNLREIFAVLGRRRRIVITTILLSLLATYAYVALTNSRYTATVEILVDPHEAKAVGGTLIEEPLSAEGVHDQIQSQLLVIESDNVLLRVVADEKLDSEVGRLGFFARVLNGIAAQLGIASDNSASPVLMALRDLKHNVTATRVENTFVINVVVASEDQQKSARLANAVAEAYLREQRDSRVEKSRQLAESLKARLADLQADVEHAERRVDEYKFQNSIALMDNNPMELGKNEAMIGLRDLERELEASRALHQIFLNRSREASEQSNLERSSARIISRATPPSTRSWPPGGLLLGLALLGGLGVGAGLAMARDHFDNRLFTRRDIEENSPFPVIGVIPHFLPERYALPREVQTMFLRLHDAIRYDSTGKTNRVILITSAGSGEGKTTIASTLAAAAAFGGERVLVFDGSACLRSICRRDSANGKMSPSWKAGAEVGAKELVYSETVVDFSWPKIESLADARRHFDLLNRLEAQDEKFDLLIVDCGAVTLDRHARWLACIAADEIVLVTRAGQTRLEEIHDAVDALGPAAQRVRGVVLNDVPVRSRERRVRCRRFPSLIRKRSKGAI